jgi:hypothetical protein
MSCWQRWLYAFDCKSKEGSSNLPQDSVKKLFETGEFDNEKIVINQKICSKQMVPWQNGYMHRSEIPEIVVQFHGVPQNY